VVALGMVLLTQVDAGSSYVTTVLPAVVVFGLGLVITVAPLTATALGAVPDRFAGVASGVNTTVARAAQLAAVAALPMAAGITGDSYRNPAEFSDGFVTAMGITAVIAALGGVLAAILVRNPPKADLGTAEPPEPAYFCGVEGPRLQTCPGASAARA
jgi:hypothetical protein